MKNLYITLLIIGLLTLILYVFIPKSGDVYPQVGSIPTPAPTPLPPENQRDISWNNTVFRISYFMVSDISKLQLFPNFDKQETSLTVRKTNGCTFLTNGGFYSKSYTPLGLFSTSGERLGDVSKSSLFNGFFSIDINGNATISTDTPSTDSPIQLQSGPILLYGGKPRKLQLTSDEHARRIFVAIDTNDIVFFGVVYDPEQTFNGPLLEDLPLVLAEFSKFDTQTSTLESALNLDGGSASVYADKYVLLGELTSVGSFFCIQ